MVEDLPEWARRITALREAKGITQAEAAEGMRERFAQEGAGGDDLLRRWQAWERGENKPGILDAPLVAATLGTVTATIFPPDTRPEPSTVRVVTGMDTLEVVSRLQRADVNGATVDAVRTTVDTLCSAYASQSPHELIAEGRKWFQRMVALQEHQLTSGQRRETLELAGWLALLIGCLEYDLGDRRAADTTRQSALRLGAEVGSPGILGWAHEMRAWFALTCHDYRGVLSAAETGVGACGNHSVAVQLLAQEAKAWARLGRRDEMQAALERGRVLLENMPYPQNLGHHFIVDPAKYDFYAMDCYRNIGEDTLARGLAEEVLRAGTDPHGRERSPMRNAEARMTLGVSAAREGELDEAIHQGRRALGGDRRSLPSLALASHDLTRLLKNRYHGEPEADAFVDEVRHIQRPG